MWAHSSIHHANCEWSVQRSLSKRETERPRETVYCGNPVAPQIKETQAGVFALPATPSMVSRSSRFSFSASVIAPSRMACAWYTRSSSCFSVDDTIGADTSVGSSFPKRVIFTRSSAAVSVRFDLNAAAAFTMSPRHRDWMHSRRIDLAWSSSTENPRCATANADWSAGVIWPRSIASSTSTANIFPRVSLDTFRSATKSTPSPRADSRTRRTLCGSTFAALKHLSISTVMCPSTASFVKSVAFFSDICSVIAMLCRNCVSCGSSFPLPPGFASACPM
mmetsp:Transcript_6096/g.12988  ORF Transcript_6096/g.12988 Transcript_6096/m.12988 type:complete len:278 (+) Transcript_6096:839-1672(+)